VGWGGWGVQATKEGVQKVNKTDWVHVGGQRRMGLIDWIWAI